MRVIESLVAVGLPVLLYMMVYTDNVIFFYMALAVGFMFILKPIVLLPFYFVASLSTSYFSLSSGMSAGRFAFVLILLSLFLQFLKNKDKVGANPNFLFVIVLIIFLFFSAITSVTGSLDPFVQMTMNLLFLFFLYYYVDLDLDRFYRFLSIAYFVCLISIAFYIMKNGQELFIQRFHDEEEAMNTNRLAMMCNQAGGLMFAMFLLSKKVKIKIISIVGYIIAILEIVILGSRSPLIALLLSSIIGFYLYQHVNKTIQRKNVYVLFFFLVFVFGVLVYYLSSIDSPLMERFTAESIVESKGTNRLNLIGIIMTKIFPNHPLLGVGVGSENIYEAGKVYGLERPAHNIIIDPLSQMGIIGFCLFLLFIAPIIVRSFKVALNNRSLCLVILPSLLLFVTTTINGIGEIIFYEKFFWNNLALCAFCLIQFRQEKYGKV